MRTGVSIGGVPPGSRAGLNVNRVVSSAAISGAHLGHGIDAGVGTPDMGLDAAGLDLDQEVPRIGDADIHPPRAVGLGPSGRLAGDLIVRA